MSGCEDRTFCETFEIRLKESYPDLTDDVIVVSDTLAPIALVCETGTNLRYAFYFYKSICYVNDILILFKFIIFCLKEELS